MDLSCFSVACYLFIEISMSSIFNTIIGNKNAVINIFSNTAFTCMLLLLLLLSRFSHVWLPPGSPVPGILQARTLEWVAISFSNAWKWKVKVKSLSRVRLLAPPWTAAYQAPPSMGFSRQEYWSGVPLPSLNPGLWEVIYEWVPQCSAHLSLWQARIASGTWEIPSTLIFWLALIYLKVCGNGRLGMKTATLMWSISFLSSFKNYI